MKDSIKKQKLLESLIKREDWELEITRANLVEAKDGMEKASSELRKTKIVLNELNTQLRDSMRNGSNIDFAIMGMAKQYFHEKKHEEKECKEIFRRAKSLTDRMSMQLTEKMVSKKGYERVLEKRLKSIGKEIEKKESREIEDNWLRRHGVEHE